MKRGAREGRVGLLTREERVSLRMIIDDLERQAERATSPERRAELLKLADHARMEQTNDRECRKREKQRRR